jgi:predicted dehydrogenase/threonine dehydrogenase-like Zn-dependent dehydrogenase
VISAGTERMLVSFGKGSLLSKARQQPDKVRQVVQKARNDGFTSAFKAVQSKLAVPIPMGYSNVGVVDAVGPGGAQLRPGMHVVSNGCHAEAVVVPENFVAQIPQNVSDRTASFTVLSSISLQGIRLADPQLGETVAVIGLGLIGLLAVQILRANGCKVIGFDYDSNRLGIAKGYGVSTVDLSCVANPVLNGLEFSGGEGVDAVLIATATNGSEPISLAAKISRPKGRVVLIGTAELSLSRDDFYKKELQFQVSCSYGVGRYDKNYEEKGQDYPIGLIRWTVKRNFEAVLQLMSEGKIKTDGLITHKFDFENAEKAYDLLDSSVDKPLAIVLDYKTGEDKPSLFNSVTYHSKHSQKGSVRIAFIGAGAYAMGTLIPAFKATGSSLHSVSSRNGLSASVAAKQFSICEATTDALSQINGDANTVVIATPHNSHAELVLAAIRAGKHVFVEKPLCISFDELEEIKKQVKSIPNMPALMVGLNRRFSPLINNMKKILEQDSAPKAFVYSVNAGRVPVNHWVQDAEIGGGRLLGEISHFIDTLRFLTGHNILDVKVTKMSSKESDTASILLYFSDGSCGTINYFTNGHHSIPKERIEVFCNGKVLQLDNFRKLKAHGWKSKGSSLFGKQNKGQSECVKSFVSAIEAGGENPIPIEELFEVAFFSLKAACIQGQ